MEKVKFLLEDDSWHGYKSELLACEPTERGTYLVAANPFYVKGISKYDEIDVKINDNVFLFSRLIKDSGYWTYRISVNKCIGIDKIQEFLNKIFEIVDISDDIQEKTIMFSICVHPRHINTIYGILDEYFKLGEIDFEEAKLGRLDSTEGTS